MRDFRPLLLALCLLAPAAFCAEKQKPEEKPVDKEAEKAGMLAETVGAYAGGALFDTYLSMTDLESITAAAGSAPAIATATLKRHLRTLNILENYDKKLRVTFSDDETFIDFLNDMKGLISALREQGDALAVYLRNPSKGNLATVRRQHETARTLLFKLLQIKGDTDIP